MENKLDKLILDYFKLIIPHDYDDLKFRYSANEKIFYDYDDLKYRYCANKKIFFITVHCNTAQKAHKFFGRKGRDLNILKQLEEDMSNMFPFDFYITCEFKVS
jgi:hypothetical protein